MSEIGEEEIARALYARSRMSPADPEVWEQADYDVRAWLLGHARAVLALLQPALERARREERAAAREAGSRIFNELVARGVDPEVMAAAIEKLADESDAELAAIRKGPGE